MTQTKKQKRKLAKGEPELLLEGLIKENKLKNCEKRKFAYPIYFIGEDYHIIKTEEKGNN